MTGASDSRAVAEFRHQLEVEARLGIDSAQSMTDSLVGPEAGALLRRCAVPHEFDSALLQQISGSSSAEADERYEQFAELSLMQVNDKTLSVHERWREPLWRWWLGDAQRDEFVTLSERLVEWFTTTANPVGEDPVARRRMFHLLGCRRAEGLQDFDQLFRTARHHRRFSECSLLLRLVHEYDPVLAPREQALLRYHEGKVAIDLRRWEGALPLLRAVAADPEADARLRANAEVRVGHALRQLGRTDDALALLEGALQRATPDSATRRSRWRVLYELGEIYRDLGLVDAASATLGEALADANDDEEEADVAGLLNSLGTVQLKLREVDRAVDSFNASLEQLRRRGDVLRSGTVFNNLGLAQLERCDWQAAELAFAASLKTKREAGDRVGQATTLLNLSRAQAAQERMDDARASADQAATLFEAGGDERGLALARHATTRLLRRIVQSGTNATPGSTKKALPAWVWMLVVMGLLLLLAFFAAALAT